LKHFARRPHLVAECGQKRSLMSPAPAPTLNQRSTCKLLHFRNFHHPRCVTKTLRPSRSVLAHVYRASLTSVDVKGLCRDTPKTIPARRPQSLWTACGKPGDDCAQPVDNSVDNIVETYFFSSQTAKYQRKTVFTVCGLKLLDRASHYLDIRVST